MTEFSDKELNIIRGKNLVGKVTKKDVEYLFAYIDELEELCDETDNDDYFGTDGWRGYLGVS